ncbi:MAG: hypothetical protein L0287_10175 [Anaerolineae bacterium]|nr:hypothetical protein [Anaerolineae bacterium]MCI0610843.1 hypothetical protein [Anaerolineae bacterium]
MEELLPNLKYLGLALYLIFILRFLFLVFKACSDIYLYEYEHLPEQWEKDGKPRGIEFWKFPKPSWRDKYRLSAWRSGAISPMVWVFVTPKWADDHPEVQRYFVNLRTNVLWWSIGITIFFCLMVFTQT